MRSWAVTWRRYLIDLAPIAVKEAHLLRGIMNSTEYLLCGAPHNG